jgi:hypothetical protein
MLPVSCQPRKREADAPQPLSFGDLCLNQKADGADQLIQTVRGVGLRPAPRR